MPALFVSVYTLSLVKAQKIDSLAAIVFHFAIHLALVIETEMTFHSLGRVGFV